jgi:hypothetical protein
MRFVEVIEDVVRARSELDEPTGQIDAPTRSQFDWKQLTRGRTVIWVEHAQEP